jgi:hypothetical protein
MASRSILVKALGCCVVVVVAVACGGSGRAASAPSARLTKSCDTLCEKRGTCGGAADFERCKTRCSTSEAFRKIDAFKAEASDQMWSCLTANVCDPDHEAMGKRCVHEVAQKLPLTPKAKSMCAKLEDAFASCGAPWATPCTEELRFFDDADLDGFGECVDRSCRSGVACFRSAEHALLSRPH